MINKITKDLSIQINLNGLSFCILDTNSNTISYTNTIVFDEQLTPFETLSRLKEELAQNAVFSSDFKNVTIIHYNSLATLVPKILYKEANNADYLKYNSKILKTDYIASDNIDTYNMVAVYVPYVNINNYIFDTFGEFNYTHASTLFINSIKIEDNNTATLFVNIVNNTMQVALFEDKQLLLYNYFEFYTPEDFIYYILFCCEQLQLNPEILKLKFTGYIDTESPIFKIAYKYIREVEIIPNSKDFLIKNSFKCE